MNFLLDAHLPKRLAIWLKERNHDVVHTSELPSKNETEDFDIIELSISQKRIVITKDDDFYKNYIIKGEPHKLLFLTMGNMVNRDLMILFERNMEQIENKLENNSVVELGNDYVTVHF